MQITPLLSTAAGLRKFLPARPGMASPVGRRKLLLLFALLCVVPAAAQIRFADDFETGAFKPFNNGSG